MYMYLYLQIHADISQILGPVVAVANPKTIQIINQCRDMLVGTSTDMLPI